MILKPMVYIAGPITLPKGGQMENARSACQIAEQLIFECDVVPMIPHLSVYWNAFSKGPLSQCLCGDRKYVHGETCDVGGFRLDYALGRYSYQEWIDISSNWLVRCDALYRMPGYSRGADHEVDVAESLDMPVLKSVGQVKSWVKKFQRDKNFQS